MLKRKIRHRTFAAPIAIALMGLMALPLVALAGTTDAIAQTGGMTATLPLLGSSLTVQVTLDSSGNLSQVNLDPVGTYSASKVSGHAVVFDSADGTTQVRIKAHGDTLSIKASAGSLGALVGSGTWSADVFGTGRASTVAYTIGKNGTAPTVTIDSVNAAAGITATSGTPAHGASVKHGLSTTSHDGKGGATASASVVLAANGYTKTLTIRVSVKGEGARPASLKITLSGRDVQKLTGALADVVGTHTWAGKACDGTALGIRYTVNADGTVTYVSATGGTVTVKTFHKGFGASFDGTRVRVRVFLIQQPDGTWALLAGYRKGGWGGCLGQTVPLPTTNAPVLPGANQPGDHAGKGHGGHSGKGWGGGHGGGH